MFRWLSDSEEMAGEVCTCRGEIEVMESRLLGSVNTISRMMGGGEGPLVRSEIEVGDLLAPKLDDGGAWWI